MNLTDVATKFAMSYYESIEYWRCSLFNAEKRFNIVHSKHLAVERTVRLVKSFLLDIIIPHAQILLRKYRLQIYGTSRVEPLGTESSQSCFSLKSCWGHVLLDIKQHSTSTVSTHYNSTHISSSNVYKSNGLLEHYCLRDA